MVDDKTIRIKLMQPVPVFLEAITRGSASMRANTRSAAERPSWNWDQNDAMLMSGHQ